MPLQAEPMCPHAFSPCSPRQRAACCSRRCRRCSPAAAVAVAALLKQRAREAAAGGVAAVGVAGHARGLHQLQNSDLSAIMPHEACNSGMDLRGRAAMTHGRKLVGMGCKMGSPGVSQSLVAAPLPLFRRNAFLAAVGGNPSSPQHPVSVSTMASLARSAAAGLRRTLSAVGAGWGALAALQQPGEQRQGWARPDRLALLASERPAPRTQPDHAHSADRRHRRAAFTSLPAGGGRPAVAAACIIVGAQLNTAPWTRAAEAATQPIMDNVRGMLD